MVPAKKSLSKGVVVPDTAVVYLEQVIPLDDDFKDF